MDVKGLLADIVRLAPSEVESQIQMLCPYDGNYLSLQDLQYFLQFLHEITKDRKSFEVIQACLHCFLTSHSGKIMRVYSMNKDVLALKAAVQSTSNDLQVLIHTSLCLIKMALNIQIV